MLSLDRATLLTYPLEKSSQYFTGSITASITACWSLCLSDNLCMGSTSLADGTGVCYLKISEFMDISRQHLLARRMSSRKPKFEGLPSRDSFFASALPVHFSYKELQQATKGFKEKLGEGGFGDVYLGVLTNKTVAAVKQLEGIEQEIISRRRNFEVSAETNHKKLSLWAYEEFEKGNIEAILDKRLLRHEVNTEQVIRAIQISFWCIQEQPSLRPTMGKVVQMLEGISEIRTPPSSTAKKSISAIGQVQVLPMVSSFQTVLNSSAPSQTAANSYLASGQKSEGGTSFLL
ncbi:unnamed protein product [Fraxinus pennsylvanica]|uniref:Uncharacterized protein n=1 Tax=Fraxinus pennsylvanica TaxID=56036 RepID=A0AAD2DJP6_9LAMI|nr:unnamed protein product [Fraxinus pennsylvanica]